LGAARTAADAAAAREARRLVEEGISAQAEALAAAEPEDTAEPSGGQVIIGSRVRTGSGAVGRVVEARSDGKLVVSVGAMRMVVDPSSVTPLSPAGEKDRGSREPLPALPPSRLPASFEIDLRGMTGDEAEAATVAAVDAAVLAEHPYIRIIHGMGTGVVRERVHRVVRGDRRIARFGFAPRNQGGTGVTIVEFPA